MGKDLVCIYFVKYVVLSTAYPQHIVEPRGCVGWYRIHTCQINKCSLSDEPLGIGSTIVSHQQTVFYKEASFIES